MKGLRPLQTSPELFFRYVTVRNPLFGEGFFASLRRAYAASPLHTLAWGDRMTIRLKPMLVAVAIPLGVGALGALASRGGMATLAALQKPPLMPPGWVFPVVWTALYIAMGVASYLIATSGAPRESRRMALCAYGVSLVLSALWPVFASGAPSSRRALELKDSRLVRLSMSRKPSDIFSVMAVNSAWLRRSSSIWRRMVSFWWWIFTSRGESSS